MNAAIPAPESVVDKTPKPFIVLSNTLLNVVPESIRNFKKFELIIVCDSD